MSTATWSGTFWRSRSSEFGVRSSEFADASTRNPSGLSVSGSSSADKRRLRSRWRRDAARCRRDACAPGGSRRKTQASLILGALASPPASSQSTSRIDCTIGTAHCVRSARGPAAHRSRRDTVDVRCGRGPSPCSRRSRGRDRESPRPPGSARADPSRTPPDGSSLL